ncbi:MAG: hypothetical protein CSA09_05030 [Candidatus Contendobacter odensis]|uniref:histidine kinase n=1 Tax=Candidatus Contendibacter odensensis TaxID=1400860 RepID=A0A2G6PE09_9GAMM|nr:MAG: hypothetical protein CSA09_05030 [Candidatus Contendobacter odensis]
MTNHPIKILLVDNQENYVQLAQHALSSSELSCDIEVVDSLRSARHWLGKNQPNVLISNLYLPDGSGIELIEQTKSPAYPVIIMTSRGDERTEVDVMKAGAIDYLIKSTDTLQELSHTVQRVLRKWRCITERKCFKTTLRESEERLRHTTMNLPGIVYRFYIHPNGKMKIHFISGCIEKMFGWTNDFLKHDDLFERFLAGLDKRDYEPLMASVHEVVATRSPWEFEGRFIRPSGEMMWFRGMSNPSLQEDILVFTGIVLNITERKRAEEALRKSEEWFRSVVQNARDVIMVLNDQNHIDYVSPRSRPVLGYEPNVLHDKTITTYLHPGDQTKVHKHLTCARVYGEAGAPVEFRFCHVEGHWVDMEAFSIHLTAHSGVQGTLMMLRDITSRKQAEQHIYHLASP